MRFSMKIGIFSFVGRASKCGHAWALSYLSKYEKMLQMSKHQNLIGSEKSRERDTNERKKKKKQKAKIAETQSFVGDETI